MATPLVPVQKSKGSLAEEKKNSQAQTQPKETTFKAQWPSEIDTSKYEAATDDNAEQRALEDISSKFLTDEEQQIQASEVANKEMRSSLKQ